MRQAGDKPGNVHFGKNAVREKPVENQEGYRHKKADDESVGQKSLADDEEIQRSCQLCWRWELRVKEKPYIDGNLHRSFRGKKSLD